MNSLSHLSTFLNRLIKHTFSCNYLSHFHHFVQLLYRSRISLVPIKQPRIFKMQFTTAFYAVLAALPIVSANGCYGSGNTFSEYGTSAQLSNARTKACAALVSAWNCPDNVCFIEVLDCDFLLTMPPARCRPENIQLGRPRLTVRKMVRRPSISAPRVTRAARP